MELLVFKKGFLFAGTWQDLLGIMADYPPQTTLKDFIQLNLS